MIALVVLFAMNISNSYAQILETEVELTMSSYKSKVFNEEIRISYFDDDLEELIASVTLSDTCFLTIKKYQDAVSTVKSWVNVKAKEGKFKFFNIEGLVVGQNMITGESVSTDEMRNLFDKYFPTIYRVRVKGLNHCEFTVSDEPFKFTWVN